MRPTAVFKLGGSLLDWPDWPARLQSYVIEKQYRPVVVVGGGPTADLVRNWQAAHAFDDRMAHQMALQAMRFNAVSIAGILSGRLVSTIPDVESCWQDETIPVVDVVEVLKQAGSSEAMVPQDWNATSDAIAAFIAGHWHFDRLVLLKSANLPAGTTDTTNDFLKVAAETQRVDPLIAGIARHFSLRVEWKNLRTQSE